MSDSIDNERSRFEKYLRSRGLRLTRQREEIFEEVFRHKGHLDAESVLKHMRKFGKKVSRATVYRTLDLLVQAGLVKPVQLGSVQLFYEHVPPGEHHDHLVCTSCGSIEEFYSRELEETQIAICRERSFKPSHHTMVIFGTCRKCGSDK